MTVNTTSITSGSYPGNDVSDEFSYNFRIEDKSQLIVYETDDQGVETILTVDTDYTVAGIGVDAGGIVTRVAGPLPTGYSWYIRSDYKETQLTAFGSQGGFFPGVHEAAMDKLTFLIQQMTDSVDRSMRLSEGYPGGTITTLPNPESQKLLRWKSDLSGFENITLGTSDLNLAVRQLSEFSSLSDAFTQIGSVTKVELWIDTNDSSINSPLTKPDNIQLRAINGFILDGTSTLTLDGIAAGFYQIFGPNITVTGLRQSSPEWWGIDGVADDVETQKAITATAGGMVCFDPFHQYVNVAGLVILDNSTHLFSPIKKAGLITSANDINTLTLDNCRYVQVTNIGFANTHGSPTKANILLAGRAKENSFHRIYSSGNKYGVLFDGAQGSVPGAVIYNRFFESTIDASTDESVYFTDSSGQNENVFSECLLANSTGQNKFIRVTGNSNKFISNSIESANTTDFTTFAVTDNSSLGNVFAFNRFETDNCGILVDGVNTDESNGTTIVGNSWQTTIPVRVAVYNGIVTTDTSGKDKSFLGISKGVFVSTTVNVESAAAQKVISAALTTDFRSGQPIVLDFGNANEEWHIIKSIITGVSLTTIGDLKNTHAIGVAIDGCNSISGVQTFDQENTDALILYKSGKTRLRVDDGTVMVGDNPTTPGIDALHIMPKTGQTQYHIRTVVESVNTRTHQRFETPDGIAGSVTTLNLTTSFLTSSDPRLKSLFESVGEQEVFNLIHEYAATAGRFYFECDKSKKEVLGFNAHEILDLEFGSEVAQEGYGPRDQDIGSEYDTGEVDAENNPIMEVVTAAGIDQSKVTPVLMIATDAIITKLKKFDSLCNLLVSKGIMTQNEIESL